MEVTSAAAETNRKFQISNLDELATAVKDKANGFAVKDRSWRLKTYPQCFIGEEAVKWIRENVEGVSSVGDAIFVGQTLLDRGVFRHVVEKKKPFLNEFLFYRFIEDDEQAIRSKRKTIPDPLVQSFMDDQKRWDRLITSFRQQVDVADRKWGLKTYPQCFLGSNAATVVVQLVAEITGHSITRTVAGELLQLMADAYLFVHVTADQLHIFRDDSKVYFKFVDPIIYATKYLKDRLRVKRIGEAKARGEGCKAKRPIVLIPGVYSSVLEVWQSEEKPSWQREKLWIDLSKVGFFSGKDTSGNTSLTDDEKRAMAKEFVRHMMPASDGHSDPPGIKVRARDGLGGIDYLTEGFFKDSSTVFALMIRNLLDVGYDFNQLIPAPYDWRIPPQALEKRDAFFSRLKASIEFAVMANGHRAVLVGHSMGCRAISYFINWIGDQSWIDQNIESVAYLAPPFLGAPFALRAMVTGDALNLYPLLSQHEGAQICRVMGSWPWLMPPWNEDEAKMLPEPAARIKFSGDSKKKKDKDTFRSMNSLDTLMSAGSPAAKYWNQFYAVDPNFFSVAAPSMSPYLEVPPVRKLVCLYGINLPTEVSYFFKINDETPGLVQAELDTAQDSISKKETRNINPSALEIRGGIMYESKSTQQPAFGKKKISGDGSIPYASMAFAWKLKERAAALRSQGKVAPEVDIVELEGIGHRAIMSNDAVIGAIIDLGCK